MVLKDHIPTPYHSNLDVFEGVERQELPPHMTHDHNIKLEEGKRALFKQLYCYTARVIVT